MVAATGVAVLWRLADDAQRRRVVEATAGLTQPVGEGAPRWAGWARLLLGVVLLAAGAGVFFASRGGIGAATTAVLAVLVALAGLLVVAGPWLYRLVRELADERAERIRSQERADLAAHVHDSVLQTLTLIQRRADDPREVVRLARAEERELRQWLYQPAAERSDSVSGALDRLAAEVEDDHGVAVDVVCVGDASVDERPGGARSRRRARRWSTPPSTPRQTARCRCTPRSSPTRSPSSSATAVPASTSPPCPPTGWACGSPSSDAWSGRAAAPRSARRPVRGARCGCRCRVARRAQ